MATILVTGDTGFIGKALVKELLDDGQRVIGVSRSTDVNESYLSTGNYVHIATSLESLSIEDVGEKIDAFIDLAWAGSMGPARGDSAIQQQNIANCLRNVDIAHELGATLYLGAGTITEVTALAPDAPAGPATTYGLSKNLAHMETKKRAQDLGIEHIWVRLGNTYSEHDTSNRFLNSTFRKLGEDEDVELLTGNQPFDFIHLTDAVKAIALIGAAGESGETYYVGNGEVKTIREFVEIARELFGSTSTIVAHEAEINLTPDDLMNTPLVELGYTPLIDFETGVRIWRDTNL